MSTSTNPVSPVPSAPSATLPKFKFKSRLADTIVAGTPLIWAQTVEPTLFFSTERNFLLKFYRRQNPAVYRFSATGRLDEYREYQAGVEYPDPYRTQANTFVRNLGATGLVEWFARQPPETNGQQHPEADGKSLPPATRSIVDGIQGEDGDSFSPDSFAPFGSVFFLLDVDAELQHLGGSRHSNPRLARFIEEVSPRLLEQSKAVVVMSHTLDIPEELEHEMVIVEDELPGEDKLSFLVHAAGRQFRDTVTVGDRVEVRDEALVVTPDQCEMLVGQLKGLTQREADNCLARAVTENKAKRHRNHDHPKEFDLAVIRSERVKAVRKNSALEIIEPTGGLELVGGLTDFKAWVHDNRPFFNNHYLSEGIPSPKGIVLFGSGGVGKSHTIACLGKELNRTVLRWDVGASKAGIVGQTEANVRRALRDAKAQSPCIFFIDEAGKLFPNARGGVGATLDGGVSSGIYASLLTFQQENDGGVLLAMACNDDIQNFPAPALRRGRIDGVFYIGLPEPAERTQVVTIHLRKRGWDEEQTLAFAADAELLRLTDKYTPSELEQVVVEAIKLKVREKGPRPAALELRHLLDAVPIIVPMSRTHAADIEAIENYARVNHYLRDDRNPARPGTAASSAGRRSSVSLADMDDAA